MIPANLLRQDWGGELLLAAHAFGSPGQRPSVLTLQFGTRWLTLSASSDEPFLGVALGPSGLPEESAAVDLFLSDPFSRFRHCPLYSWWLLENEHGSQDGLLMLFDRTEGMIVLAQPGWLEFLAVSTPVPGQSA
jgi:hypothetical protein